MAVMAALLVALSTAAVPAKADGNTSSQDVIKAVVGISALIPEDARTAEHLGTVRSGSGVVIDGDGLVLTIGYLILEASAAAVS